MLLTYLLNFLLWPIYFISACIPKNKSIWVFGSWFGNKFSDNPKKFFEYIQNEQKKIRPIWITKNKQILKQKNTIEIYYWLSIKGIFYQAKASMIFITHSVNADLLAAAVSKRTKIIQLYHGVSLKKIMNDSSSSNKPRFIKYLYLIFPYLKPVYFKIIASSLSTQKIFMSAFNKESQDVLITGYPRNDVFLNSKVKKNEYFDCIYMPTFRANQGSEFNLFESYGFNEEKISKTLRTNNIRLTIRLHPADQTNTKFINNIKPSKYIRTDSSTDIYDNISYYSCLITDYSSIFVDFLLSGKPIVFSPFDLENYLQKERDMYFNYHDVTLSPYALNWNDVINRLVQIKVSSVTNEYKSKYERILNLFHDQKGQEYKTYSEKLFVKLSNEI